MDASRHRKVEEIDAKECLRLLREKAFVGRVAFLMDGKPMILPVNYIFDDNSIAFCTAPGTSLSEVGDGNPVAFEVDSSRPRSGWSVVVQGTATRVQDEQQLMRLSRGPLESWAWPISEEWIQISIEDISGRRIGEPDV